MTPLLLFSNHRQIRRRRRRCCSVALFLGTIGSLFCAANRIITQQHPRPSSLSFSSSLLSFRGGSSSNYQKQQSLSKNNNEKSSPFEYIPITALNDYGQSTQLRYAMEASARYGTPIIACLCCCDDDNDNEDISDKNDIDDSTQRNENTIVICSLQRPRWGIIAPSIPTMGASSTNIRRYSSSSNKNNNSSVKVHPSIQGLVKVLATRDDVDDDVPIHILHTAIVSTGIQSDATFLVSQLQRHLSKFWFRYNTIPTSTLAVVKNVREVLLDCMGYDWSEEVSSAKVSGGVGSAALSYNENDEDDGDSSAAAAAGRPLGVSSLLLSFATDDILTSSSSMQYPRPTITLIEANGSSEQYVARAMGVGAQRANELLSEKWKRGMSREEVKEMMGEILAEVAIERGWMSGDDGGGGGGEPISDSIPSVERGNAMHVGLTIACETLTTRGIDIEFSPLQRFKKCEDS
jgi:hypothetical protein